MRRVSGRWSPKCKSKSPARYGRLGRSEVLCKTTGLGMLLVTVSMGMWAVKLYFSKILQLFTLGAGSQFVLCSGHKMIVLSSSRGSSQWIYEANDLQLQYASSLLCLRRVLFIVSASPHGQCSYFSGVSVCLWWPCVIGQTIIFLPCDFYLSSFFPSPNLSCRTLDVYHTLSHGVALV